MDHETTVLGSIQGVCKSIVLRVAMGGSLPFAVSLFLMVAYFLFQAASALRFYRGTCETAIISHHAPTQPIPPASLALAT